MARKKKVNATSEGDYAAYREHVRKRLDSLVPVFIKMSVGDFSSDISIRGEKEDEFTPFFVGIQLMLEVVREQLGDLHRLNTNLEKLVEERTAEILNKKTLLRKQTELYENLLKAQGEMGQAVVITEGEKIIYFNDALPGIYGYSAEELLALPSFIQLIAPELRDEFVSRLRKRISGESHADSGQTIVVRGDGKRINIEYWLKMIYQGEQRQIISIVRDITGKKESEQKLQAERHRAESAEMAKHITEMFLANISHELRTPMNSILGYAHLLGGTGLNKEQDKHLHVIRNSAEHLLVIINDLLDLAKLEAGKIKFEKRSFSIANIINSTIDLIRTKADQRGNRLVVNISPQLHAPVIGDPVRLRQVLLNLLSNANKFSEAGTITISAEVKEFTHQKIEVLFSVTDTGIGIPAEKLPNIFDRFGLNDQRHSDNMEGTGIGLAIVKQLVTMQGGLISVTSKVNEGSSFYCSLQYEPERTFPSEKKKISLPPPAPGALKGKRVLIVEDNSVNTELVKILVEKWGGIPDSAADGVTAIEKISQETYDIVLLDLRLPDMNGFDVAKKIRNGKTSCNLPLIALTAHAIEGMKARCIEAGMNDYLSKPFHPDELYARMAALLTAERNDAKHIAVHSSGNRVVDLSYVDQVTGGDEIQKKRIVHAFIETAPLLISIMFEEAGAGNTGALQKTIHKFRSGATAIFTKKIVDVILNAEEKCSTNTMKSYIDTVKQLDEILEQALHELQEDGYFLPNDISSFSENSSHS